MDGRFLRILAREQATGFDDLRGARASLTLPVSERLLNEIVAETLPPTTPVRDLYVKPMAGDRFAVRLRLGSSGALPALTVAASIDRQPALPDLPVLVLKLEASGLLSLGLPALRFVAMPPGVRIEHDRVHVDIRQVLQSRGLADYFGYVRLLEVHTIEGAVILSLQASIED